MTTMETPSPVTIGAAARICTLLATPCIQGILESLEHGESSAKMLTTTEHKYHTILKYLRQLMAIHVVRRQSVGAEITYKLNHDRLEKIYSAIGVIQPADY